MLKFHYSRETVEKHVKEEIEELAGVFFQFDKLNEEARRDYLENSYAPKIVSIASNLNELGIHPFQSAPENFDPRYVQEYGGGWNITLAYGGSLITKSSYVQGRGESWTKDMDERAKTNQGLIDFLEKCGLAPTPEARFVLYNSLLYLDGKEVDEFKQIEVEVKDSSFTRLKNFIVSMFRHAPSLDMNALAELSEKPFDYLKCPFDGSMDGFCSSVFAKDNKVYARFSREEFEEYMLKREYDELASELNLAIKVYSLLSKTEYDKLAKQLNLRSIEADTVVNDPRHSRKIRGTYSDSAMERLEKRLDSGLVASLFLTSALKHAVRTKTRLSFDGKKRSGFHQLHALRQQNRRKPAGKWKRRASEGSSFSGFY